MTKILKKSVTKSEGMKGKNVHLNTAVL